MTLQVPYIADDAIERDAEALLAQYAHARGVEIKAPIPIEDIVEKHLKQAFSTLKIGIDNVDSIAASPRSAQIAELAKSVAGLATRLSETLALDPSAFMDGAE